ncbi:MFS transporter [uncultured Mailhella sp.]|uniref:MFS transporter n=1 Tax=uncultured Mailhella sp. TaxID=1981031 RepID=UPI0025D54F18|nr:MFS transporter [uncultured Mailhella sp.]
MNYRKILLLSLGHLSCDLNSHALPALLPYLAAAHGFDYQTCGFLAFAYSAVASLVQPGLGLLADKIARGWFIPLGILMASMGIGATGFLSNEYAMFVSLVLGGIGAAVFHPEAARYANIVSGDHKGVGLSIFSVGGNGGMLVGPVIVMLAVGGVPLGGMTLGGFGLHGTAAFCLLGVVMASVLLWRVSAWDMEARTPKAAQSTGSAANEWGSFGILSGCLLTRMGLTVAFTTYLPLYWQGVFHSSVSTGNLMLVLFSIFGVASNLSGGAAADRWGFRRVIRWASFLSLPILAVFPLVTSPWLAGVLLAPLAIALFAPFSSMVVLGQRYLSKNMGFASGITLGVAVSVGGMFAPVLGRVADLWGGLAPAMHLLTPLAVIGAVCACFLREPKAN